MGEVICVWLGLAPCWTFLSLRVAVFGLDESPVLFVVIEPAAREECSPL